MTDKDIEAFMDKLANESSREGDIQPTSKSEQEFADLFHRLGEPTDDELSENSKYPLFQHRLAAYQAGLEDAKAETASQTANQPIPFLQSKTPVISLLAAACLMIGALVIVNVNYNRGDVDSALRTEVAGLKNMLVLSLLSHESPVQRMDGITQVGTLDAPSSEITDQLFAILNNDPNVNVRLAAISSLGALDPTLSNRLLDSLADQSSVLVQLEIVHTVLNFGRESDHQRLKQLIADSDLAPERATRFQRVMNPGI